MSATIAHLESRLLSTLPSEGPLQRDLGTLGSGMRPAFSADLQRFVDDLMKSRPQTRATLQDYGVLSNLCAELQTKYGATLSEDEKNTLQSTQRAFRTKASRGGMPFGAAKLPRHPVDFPSLTTPPGQPQGFGTHVRSTDGRMKLSLAANEPQAPRARFELTRALDPSYFQSVVELTVDRARAGMRARKGMSAAEVLQTLGQQLVAGDASLKFQVHPGTNEELGVERAMIEIYR